MTKQNNLYGIIFMLINSFAIASLYAVNKQLMQTLPSSQATFLYKLVVFLCITPWVFRKGLSGIKTPVLKLHIIRGFLSIGGSLCFAYGLKRTNLMNATAIGYFEQVLWAIIGVVYFKEKMTSIKLGAIMMSFVAMVMIIFPPQTLTSLVTGQGLDPNKDEVFDLSYLFVMAGAAFWAVNASIVKILGKSSVRSDVQAFYVLLFGLIFAYPTAFMDWEWHKIGGSFLAYPTFDKMIDWSNFTLTNTQILQIIAVGLMYFIHVISFFFSLKYAEMSTVAPFDYSRLIFTCLLSYLFMGQTPQYAIQYIGYGIIIFSGVILVTLENSKKKS